MPNSAAPPPLGDETKKDVLGHAQAEGTGQNTPGKDVEKPGEEQKKVKSAKELEKERKKAEKVCARCTCAMWDHPKFTSLCGLPHGEKLSHTESFTDHVSSEAFHYHGYVFMLTFCAIGC